MPLTTVADLVATLRSLHLLEPAQLEKLAGLQSKFPDPQAMLKKLVAQGWLTALQAKQLFHGRGADLVYGSYILHDRLGEGGMGEVFKARNWKLGKIVALKVIRKERLKNELAIKRFQREVEIASHLSHPNIVQALDAGQAGNTLFFAMEFVDGIDLGRLVKEKGPLPVDKACDYVRQAACGLAHAHERGLVHRDIKPPNLLVSRTPSSGRGEVVKILDMGLARMADLEDTMTLTQEGSVLGTVDYLSPEQALNAHQADARSDLYSLGCTFYYLLTGQVPFPGGTATEKLLKHRLEEAVPVEKARPEVSPAVAGIVRRLMAKRPEDRIQKSDELAASLSSDCLVAPPLVPGGIKGGANGRLGRAWPRFRVGRLNPRWLMIGGGGMLLLVVLLAAIAFSGRDTSQARNTGGKTTGGKTTSPAAGPEYVKKATREESILHTLRSAGLPTLEGKWSYIGPFDNLFGKGFETAFPPETTIDLTKSYTGKFNTSISWKEFPNFRIGQNTDLSVFSTKPFNMNHMACTYLHHEIQVKEALDLPIEVGGDDTITLWLNNERLVAANSGWFLPPPTIAPDKHQTQTMRLRPGTNVLLIKVCNHLEQYAVYVCPGWPAKLEAQFGASLRRDFGSR